MVRAGREAARSRSLSACQSVHIGGGQGVAANPPVAAFHLLEAVLGAVEATHPAPSDSHKRNEELVWLIRRLLEADENTLLAGVSSPAPWTSPTTSPTSRC
jgi:hypothetical protein